MGETLLLEHKPMLNGRGYPVISIVLNSQNRYDRLKWLVRLECSCEICLRGDGPGVDEYDVDAKGFAFPNRGRHPADIDFKGDSAWTTQRY